MSSPACRYLSWSNMPPALCAYSCTLALRHILAQHVQEISLPQKTPKQNPACCHGGLRRFAAAHLYYRACEGHAGKLWHHRHVWLCDRAFGIHEGNPFPTMDCLAGVRRQSWHWMYAARGYVCQEVCGRKFGWPSASSHVIACEVALLGGFKCSLSAHQIFDWLKGHCEILSVQPCDAKCRHTGRQMLRPCARGYGPAVCSQKWTLKPNCDLKCRPVQHCGRVQRCWWQKPWCFRLSSTELTAVKPHLHFETPKTVLLARALDLLMAWARQSSFHSQQVWLCGCIVQLGCPHSLDGAVTASGLLRLGFVPAGRALRRQRLPRLPGGCVEWPCSTLEASWISIQNLLYFF